MHRAIATRYMSYRETILVIHKTTQRYALELLSHRWAVCSLQHYSLSLAENQPHSLHSTHMAVTQRQVTAYMLMEAVEHDTE